MTAIARRTGTNRSVAHRWVAAAQQTGAPDSYAGKRSTPRTMWDTSAVIKLVSGRDHGDLVYAKCKDVSLGGMGIFARRAIGAMTAVEVWVGNSQERMAGRVMHCTPMLGGYLIGVEFEKELRTAG